VIGHKTNLFNHAKSEEKIFNLEVSRRSVFSSSLVINDCTSDPLSEITYVFYKGLTEKIEKRQKKVFPKQPRVCEN